MSLASHDIHVMPALLDKLDKYFDDLDDQPLDFKEFAHFTRDFIPEASHEQLEQMFKNITEHESSTITKKQLQDSTFFTEFIRTSDKIFSLREQTFVNQQQSEVIAQLQDYINSVGRPAEFENERLKQEVRAVKEEKRFLERQNEALHSEISALQAIEQRNREEIRALQQEQEDNVQELSELQLHADASATSTNELEMVQKDLESEQQRSWELQDTIRKLTDMNRANESQIRQMNLDNKRFELEVSRLTEKNERLLEELAQCSDQWKIERVRADTLAETVITLQSNLSDQDDIIQERDRLTNTPAMKINTDGFILDGLSVTDSAMEDDLFSQIEQDDATVLLTRPVSLLEATPEPTASPRPRLKSVVRKARKFAHKRSKSANVPSALSLLAPGNNLSRPSQHLGSSSDLLTVPLGMDTMHSPTDTMPQSKTIVDTIRETIKNEMIQAQKSVSKADGDKNEELLTALAQLQNEVTSLKQDVGRSSGKFMTKQPRWATLMQRTILGEMNDAMHQLVEEVKDAGKAKWSLWPFSSHQNNEAHMPVEDEM